MQYILSQEELDALKATQKIELGMAEAKLQKLCTKIADEMPIYRSWDKDNKSPWGCLITATEGEDSYDEWYCDDCPVQAICPYEWKSWSK